MRQPAAMTRLTRHAAAFLALLGLVRCSGALPPYETVPPPLPPSQQADKTAPMRVAVCYNAFTASAEEVRAIAAQSCGAGTTPHPVEHDMNLSNCPLLTPSRATFACTAP